MKNINIGNSGLMASEIALGCMRIAKMEIKDASFLLRTALEQGINFFDHADIYGSGTCEEQFARAMAGEPGVRQKMILQTKCGIRKGFYDSSREHILESAEASLRKLGTDYIDLLLIHRPDALAEPEEIAEAFARLHASGKVRYFGVSNHNPMQLELLRRYVGSPLIVNQLQLSITNTTMMDAGLNVNMENEAAVNRDGSVLDYCRLHNITVQAWSPFQYGFFEGVFLESEKFPELNRKIAEVAEKYGMTDAAVAIAWILRHPAKIQPIVGTTNPRRLTDICAASRVELTRQEWYEIYRAAGNRLP